MIKQFEVRNYKCHEGNNYFSLPGLTIVSGTNNSGKSSLLQSIYLLTQSKMKAYPFLAINDELKLGTFSDILNKNQPNSETLELSFTFDEVLLSKYGVDELIVNLVYKNPNSLSKITLPYFETNPILVGLEFVFKKLDMDPDIINLEIVDEKTKSIIYKISGELDEGYCKVEGIIPEPIIYKDIAESERVICSQNIDSIRSVLKLINTDNIKYIKAFRVESFTDGNKSFNNVGLSGEHTAEVIHKYWDTLADFSSPEEDGKLLTFSKVFDNWVKKLLGENYRIRSTSLDKDKFKINIHDLKTGNEYSLDQVGFGISQILPILTLLLSSKRDEIILIENPEVHLHPKLQSQFVDLCLFVLANNRKIIIETHSEHIINRIRLRIKENNSLLDKTNILFFEKNEESEIVYSDIEITKDGRLSHWPNDFFDQTYKDLLGLID